MAVFTTVAFATFFLENNHFVAFYELLLNSANDFGTFYSGGAYFDFAFHIGQEHAVELYGCSFFYLVAKIVNIQEAVFFCFELLSLNFYDYVRRIV